MIRFLSDKSPHAAARILNRAWLLIFCCFVVIAFVGPPAAKEYAFVPLVTGVPIVFALMTVVCPNCGKSPALRYLGGPMVGSIPFFGIPKVFAEKTCSKCGEDLTKNPYE